MTWNYRIIKKKTEGFDEVYYEMHEVYYNDDGSIYALTENPIAPYGATIKELKQSLSYMQAAFEKKVLIDGKIKFVDNNNNDNNNDNENNNA